MPLDGAIADDSMLAALWYDSNVSNANCTTVTTVAHMMALIVVITRLKVAPLQHNVNM